MANIAENIKNIRARVKDACDRSGRSYESVTIMGVTKTIGIDDIKCAVNEGICVLGENRPQELVSKYDRIENVHWHLIGHLQTNKVKYIIDKAELIHSVYTTKLAEEIDRQSLKHNKITDILIEVNISGEESKGGISPNEIDDFLKQLSEYENIRTRGFMTMAPLYASKEEIRQIFRKMYQIFVDISTKKYDNTSMDYLSMGMSKDFEIAVEEGANIIRVGSLMFK